jgi:uncharacterized UBP type Zn finger protein
MAYRRGGAGQPQLGNEPEPDFGPGVAAFLATAVPMGFSENAARRALEQVRGADVALALEWLMEHAGDASRGRVCH